MKVKLFSLVLCIFALLLISCPDPIDGSSGSSGGGGGGITTPSDVPPRLFWAADFTNDTFYQLEAELLAEGANCRIWAEKGSGISQETANSMAKAYESEILPKMLNTFSIKENIYSGGRVIARNTIELADYFGDGDGKLTILLLDIKDGFKMGENESYVAGYFWGVNFIENDPRDTLFRYSNECDMIYIDTNPGRPGSRDSNATFAHEMQHMMSLVTTLITDRYPYPLDTWIDEGLSESAAWAYLGSHHQGRIRWYNDDLSGLIRKGNTFFVWDNRERENQYAVLDDYATVYLFFQWLRLQAGNTRIYLDIIMSDNSDYRAVLNAANSARIAGGGNNWGTLLKTWLAANYIRSSSGPYGYRGDSTLNNIQTRTVPSGTRSVPLFPGEGVYSITNDFDLPGSSSYINYAGLDISSSSLSDTSTYSGGALLTYNSNTNPAGPTATGTTTGVASNISASIEMTGSLTAITSLQGPFAIGAGDVLRRNGYGESSGFLRNGFIFEKLDRGNLSIEQ